MIIHLQFGFSQFISFREEDLWNFSQSEHINGPGSHIEYPTGTKNSHFVEDHPRNIPAKFGSNRPSGFGEEAWNVKSLQTTDAKWWQYFTWTFGPGELIITGKDNFRRKKKSFAWLLVKISYERNQKGSFYIFSYTRNYEQSDRLDYNCISHKLSNDKTSIH